LTKPSTLPENFPQNVSAIPPPRELKDSINDNNNNSTRRIRNPLDADEVRLEEKRREEDENYDLEGNMDSDDEESEEDSDQDSDEERELLGDEGGSDDEEKAVGHNYCRVCMIQQPIRSLHCQYCKRCVASYDHHCHILNTCIGERNHGAFWWFLLAVTIGTGVLSSCIWSGFRVSLVPSEWFSTNGWHIFLACFYYPLFLTMAGLWAFHTWLALTGGIGSEFMRENRLYYLRNVRICDLPYSRGCANNVTTMCCTASGIWHWILEKDWTPTLFAPVDGAVDIDRDSENWADNVWENKYYSCC